MLLNVPINKQIYYVLSVIKILPTDYSNILAIKIIPSTIPTCKM